jgi:DNA repair protein RAD16
VKWKPNADLAPADLSPQVSMLKFQLESLAWMTEQEENPKWRGGILADDMGMGKVSIETCTI